MTQTFNHATEDKQSLSNHIQTHDPLAYTFKASATQPLGNALDTFYKFSDTLDDSCAKTLPINRFKIIEEVNDFIRVRFNPVLHRFG